MRIEFPGGIEFVEWIWVETDDQHGWVCALYGPYGPLVLVDPPWFHDAAIGSCPVARSPEHLREIAVAAQYRAWRDGTRLLYSQARWWAETSRLVDVAFAPTRAAAAAAWGRWVEAAAEPDGTDKETTHA